jgi:hypothetical protein
MARASARGSPERRREICDWVSCFKRLV